MQKPGLRISCMSMKTLCLSRLNLSRFHCARILLMLGDMEEANKLLTRLEDAAVAGNRAGSLVKIRCIQAITLHSSRKTPEAVKLLEKTLAQAEPEAFIRSFSDEGPMVAELLSLIIQAGSSPQEVYARQILSAFEQNVPSSQAGISEFIPGSRTKPVTSLPSGRLVEPLTRREQEVLYCMAEGLSNRETARRLSIETSTVKRHINNIFSKLDAENRVQALKYRQNPTSSIRISCNFAQ